MADWKETVNLSDLWEAYENSRIEANELAIKVSDRLSATVLFNSNEHFRDVIDELRNEAADNADFDIDTFDAYLHDVYDIADINHSLWIRTF